MRHIDDCAVCVMPPGTCLTTETHKMTIDCADYDQANIYVGHNTCATTKADLLALKVTEGTNTSCGTAIVSLTGGTSVVADSTGFVIPTCATLGHGAVAEFQIDLRKRKRYIDVSLTPGDNTAYTTYGIALLSRGTYSRDTAAEKYCKNYGSATSGTSVALVIQA